MSPNVFEINEDKIYKDKCCGEFYAMFFLFMLKEKCRAGPVKILQDQQVLGVTGLQGQYHFELALRPGESSVRAHICHVYMVKTWYIYTKRVKRGSFFRGPTSAMGMY